MADPVDVLLNIAGWIVAGLVTLLGVLVAQALGERNRERAEDRAAIYEPIRRETENISSATNKLDAGYGLWTRSEEFRRILTSGLLRPKRHDDLRRDIDTLIAFDEKHEVSRTAFYNARENAIVTTLERSEVQNPATGAWSPWMKAVGSVTSNREFNGALAKGDRALWDRTLEPRHVRPPSDALFEVADGIASGPRSAFRATGEELLAQAKRIRDRIDAAIRTGKVYCSP